MHIVSAADLLFESAEDLQALLIFERESTGLRSRLYAVGDVGFCGHLLEPDGFDPWAEVGPALRGGDVVFANLETPLVSSSLLNPASPAHFLGSVPSAGRLADGGFHVVSLANNHIADAGPEGIVSTLDAVESVGVATLGAGPDRETSRRLVATDLGDLKVGWLGCARTLQKQGDGAQFWELDSEELLGVVGRHRDAVDILVVSLHLGYMLVDYPHPDHRQLMLDLAKAGADLVLAHHAHVVQGIEVTPEGTGICHNLGNFLFDWTVGEIPVDIMMEQQRCGVVVVVDLDRDGICRLAAVPTRVDDDWVVRWHVGDSGRMALERLARISNDLSGDYDASFRAQRSERNTSLALRSMARSLGRGEVWPVLSMLPRLRGHHLAMVLRWLVRRLSWKTDG